MADAPTPSPELSRSVLVLARTLVATARSWALYLPEHPAVGASLEHRRAAIRDSVCLNTEAIGAVTHEHPSDPFRPQVRIIQDGQGCKLEEPILVNTWESDGRGDVPWAIVEAGDPATTGIDPLKYM